MKKLVENIFNRLRPAFEGKVLGIAKPLFEATELFLLSPTDRTVDAPHVRDPASVKRFMSTVMLAVMPCIAASVYFFGFRILAMIAVTYATGIAIEVVFAWMRKEDINEGFFVTGLLFPMILPPGTPLWMVSLGTAFGVLVGKELFGGTGRNLFNPALVGRCFLALGYSKEMASDSWTAPGSGLTGNFFNWSSEAVTSATPLAEANKAIAEGSQSVVTLWDLLWGNVSGCAGETCAVAILLAGVILVVTGVANWRIILSTLIGFLALGWVLDFANPAPAMPLLWQMLAGGFMFGMIFMATDPVTAPSTNPAKWFYGLMIGAVTILIRTVGGYPEGMMFAILLANIAAPLLDEVVIQVRIRRLRHER